MIGDAVIKWLLSLFIIFHCSYSQTYMDTLAVKSNIHSGDWMFDASFKCRWIEKTYQDRERRLKHWDKIANEYKIIVVECCQCDRYLRIKGTMGGQAGVSSSYCDECARDLLYKEELPLPIPLIPTPIQSKEINA